MSNFPRWFVFELGFMDGALFVRYDSEGTAWHILPDGGENFYGGTLSSVVGQCKTYLYIFFSQHALLCINQP